MTTPILIITFNRPDHVRSGLTEIRKQQPTELYVSQDGPQVDIYRGCSTSDISI